MKKEFDAMDSQGKAYPVSVESAPDHCPLCHVSIDPRFYFAFFLDNEYHTVRNNHVQAVLQCPRTECRSVFIAYYCQFNERYPRESRREKYQLDGLAPYAYERKTFPDSINKLSTSFCTIFNEAAEAEHRKLKNIAGPGYRKALEFLVKDFLISEYPDEVEEIRKQWLGNLIRDKIQDGNIRGCAERAAWLGNDETHYLRKWNDKDIGDLKTLITLSVNWIDSYLLTREYMKSMEGTTKD